MARETAPNARDAATWLPVADLRPNPRNPRLHGSEIAALARQHNNANVLVLPARFMSEEDAIATLKAWLDTPFEGGRHERRVEKIELPEAS